MRLNFQALSNDPYDSYGLLERSVVNGHLEVVKWLETNFKLFSIYPYLNSRLINMAAENGHLDLLKWFESTMHLIGPTLGLGCSYSLIFSAEHHLDVFEWLCQFVDSRIYITYNDELLYTFSEVFISISGKGQLSVLKSLYRMFRFLDFDSVGNSIDDYIVLSKFSQHRAFKNGGSKWACRGVEMDA